LATVQQERFPEFLRYHLLCEQPRIRAQRLFKLVRERVKTPPDVFSLMEALERRAELYAALADPNHSYWIERQECRPFIRELHLFKVRQMTPLLFAAWEKFPVADFSSVLRTVSVLSFRYSVVSGLNTNALEPVYHEAAKAVLDGAARTPAAVFAVLKSIYVDDDKLEQDFARFTVNGGGQARKLAKYILARFEEDASGKACDPDTDPATIEHVLPENPAEEWNEMFPKDNWEDYVYRLGNLTPLEPGINRDIGNADYLRKVASYSASNYQVTRDLATTAPAEWTPALLEARQTTMSKRARHLWRVSF
jgi:hypothetical protein